MISGWLFDAYPLDNKMIFWIKQENGNTVRLEDNTWNHSIYVVLSDHNNDKPGLLSKLLKQKDITSLLKDYEFVIRYEKITDTSAEPEVLKLTLSDSTQALTLAKRIQALGKKFGEYRLYNVDLLPEQSYFYEHNIFPLAFCKVSSNGVINYSKLSWVNKDDVWSTDYQLPEFKIMSIKVTIKKEQKLPRYSDKILSISVKKQGHMPFEIQNESEYDIMKELEREVAKADPDFIFTDDGDSFMFPYLIYRAKVNDNTVINLNRESTKPLKKHVREGTSYFSYGRVCFRPTTMRLYGRIHLDRSNSFIWNDSGLSGLYEIVRICRMPIHTASRASIGKCLSSLQFYHATQKGVLIPWKSTIAEHFKNFKQLLIADRGGFIFEPEIGVHGQVAEFDFVSLYPNIMFRKNLSTETIMCGCCPDSDLKVPELLYYHICKRRAGIVPISLEIVLEKRAKYKQLSKLSSISASASLDLNAIYEARQSVLKWILVTSFGYLGYNNAKFGRIDAHIAVCAFDRQILLQTAKIAEIQGFRVLHGIVDSIWIKRKDSVKTAATQQQKEENEKEKEKAVCLFLKESIEKETGFAISFEGVYKWIAFVHSKVNTNLPVPNRYFGVFEDSGLDDGIVIKIRGIEARRHDTPIFFSKFQQQILEVMARGNTIDEVKALMPVVADIYKKYTLLLKERRISLEELVFTKVLSKDSHEYLKNRNTLENDALQQLGREGKCLKAGQILRYIIRDYYYCKKKRYGGNSSNKTRTIPIELINEKTYHYDVKRYTELLAEICNSATEPFGYKVNKS
jgi:DNA polymerase elongation subunit (family B)